MRYLFSYNTKYARFKNNKAFVEHLLAQSYTQFCKDLRTARGRVGSLKFMVDLPEDWMHAEEIVITARGTLKKACEVACVFAALRDRPIRILCHSNKDCWYMLDHTPKSIREIIHAVAYPTGFYAISEPGTSFRIVQKEQRIRDKRKAQLQAQTDCPLVV